jgi:hypothetical protein
VITRAPANRRVVVIIVDTDRVEQRPRLSQQLLNLVGLDLASGVEPIADQQQNLFSMLRRFHFTQAGRDCIVHGGFPFSADAGQGMLQVFQIARELLFHVDARIKQDDEHLIVGRQG